MTCLFTNLINTYVKSKPAVIHKCFWNVIIGVSCKNFFAKDPTAETMASKKVVKKVRQICKKYSFFDKKADKGRFYVQTTFSLGFH